MLLASALAAFALGAFISKPYLVLGTVLLLFALIHDKAVGL